MHWAEQEEKIGMSWQFCSQYTWYYHFFAFELPFVFHTTQINGKRAGEILLLAFHEDPVCEKTSAKEKFARESFGEAQSFEKYFTGTENVQEV